MTEAGASISGAPQSLSPAPAGTAATSVTLATGAALLLPAALSGLATVGLTPVMPRIGQVFAAEPYAAVLVRFMVTAIGLTMIVGAPLAGLLADRLGRRRVLVFAMALYGVAGCAGYVLVSLKALVLSRIVLGLAMATIGTIATTIITLRFEGAARNRWLGLYSTTGTLFVLGIIPLAGWVGSIDWRGPFLLHGLAFLLALLSLFALPGDAPASSRPAPSQNGGARGGISPRWLLFMVLAGSLVGSGPLFVPFRLTEIGITDPARISMALLPSLAGAGIASFSFGRVRRHLSLSATFVISFTLAATNFLGVATFTQYWQIQAAQLVGGLGLGMIAPNLFAMAAGMADNASRGRVMGMAYAAFFAGPFVAQILLEPVTQRTDTAGALTGLALIAGALALFQARAILRPSTLQ